jgi:hydrogenase-4 membrane subunit HyfE
MMKSLVIFLIMLIGVCAVDTAAIESHVFQSVAASKIDASAIKFHVFKSVVVNMCIATGKNFICGPVETFTGIFILPD